MFDPVSRHCSLPAVAGISMIAGPAWLRSYPDRGGPVHQQRREKLMRRASTCLAVLGLPPSLALSGRRLGRADGHVQSQGGADPKRLPAHRQHPRRRYRGRSRITIIAAPNTKARRRRLIGVERCLPAEGQRSCTRSGFPTCSNSVLEQIGPSGCPKRLGCRPGRQGASASSPSVANV